MLGATTNDYVPIQWNPPQPHHVTSHPSMPLSDLADAFERIAKVVDSRKSGGTKDLRVYDFCEACSSMSIPLAYLGVAFKFADYELSSRLRDLTEASRSYRTLPEIIDADKANRTVTKAGSHSRNLRRVRQGIELEKALFENFLASNEQSLKEAATSAYTQACAPYHAWGVRKAVSLGIHSVPSRNQLLLKLNETHESAGKKMRRFINAAGPIIEYIDEIYTSRNIRLDW